MSKPVEPDDVGFHDECNLRAQLAELVASSLPSTDFDTYMRRCRVLARFVFEEEGEVVQLVDEKGKSA